jgi:tripartite-type tricarboxylate transporter receptor subunit TctC
MRVWNSLFCAVAIFLSSGGAGRAQAQTFPDHTITLIIPFAPGGSTSIVGRVIADKMSQLLGVGIVVDNRPGAGGTVGTRMAAKSDPDGYTILLGYTGTLAIGPSLYKDVGYDPRKDFAPIGMIGNAPSALVVHPSFPARSVAELIAYAKANPGKVNFGSAGTGSVNHITGEYFARSAGITLVHIPYKGTGPALTDLLGGHIPMALAPIPAVHANVTAGLLRALAVTGKTRSGLMPEVPTIAEAGLTGFEASLYYGLVAPAGTPRPVIDKLNRNCAPRSPPTRSRSNWRRTAPRSRPARRRNMPISSTRMKRNGRSWSRPAASSRNEGTGPVSWLTCAICLLQGRHASHSDSP